MSAYGVDVIIPCGTSTRRPAQIRPVVESSGIYNMTVQVTNNLGDASPVWVTTTNGHAVETPNFVKETANWQLGIRVTGDADSASAFVAEPKCFVAAAESGSSVSLATFADATDDEIAAMIYAAHMGVIDLQADAGWAVGDSRTIRLSLFTGGTGITHYAQSNDIVISSFADYNGCGCVMQFDFKKSIQNTEKMNATDTNSGGYGASVMYTTTLPRMADALPAYLRNMLIAFPVLSSAGGQSGTINTVTGNLLALRSEIEVLGTIARSMAGEGSLIPYYATSANRSKGRVAYSGNYAWLLRSPYSSGNSSYASVTSAGAGSTRNASTACGLAPFGCI